MDEYKYRRACGLPSDVYAHALYIRCVVLRLYFKVNGSTVHFLGLTVFCEDRLQADAVNYCLTLEATSTIKATEKTNKMNLYQIT